MPEYGRGGGRGGYGMGGGMKGGRGGGRFSGGGNEDHLDPEHEQFRKLFVGGLSYETTTEGLKGHFETYGEIVDCVVMKDPNSKRSRGFGFVTFKEAAMLDDAQENRPHKIDGRETETKRAMPREESGRSESQQSVTKLFIGGCKDDTTEEHLRETFSPFGEIEKIDLIQDRTTGKTKGFSFVTFKDYDSVDKCVLKKVHNLNGRNVEVKKAENKEEKAARAARGGGMMGQGWGGDQGFGGQGFGRGQGGFGGGGFGGRSGYGGGYGNQGGYGGGGGGNYNNNWGSGGYDSGYGGGYNQGGGGGGNWGGASGGGDFSSSYGSSYGAGYGSGGGGGGSYGNSSYGGGGNYGSGGGNYGGGGSYSNSNYGGGGGGSGNYGGYNRR